MSFERIGGLGLINGSLHEYIVERATEQDTRYTFRFKVRGSGTFPFDMLRRDGAFPSSELDSYTIASGASLRVVSLTAHHERKLWLPTFDRWKSFGWHVLTTANEEAGQ